MSFRNNRSLTGKIILALLLACLTLSLSWAVTNFSFQKIKEPVQRISEPNPQLKLVNKLLKDVVQLDQFQRMQASEENAKGYKPFLKQSQLIKNSLDTLRALSRENRDQLNRIDTMKSILERRDKIFIRYLNLRQHFLENDTLTDKIQLLSDFINNNSIRSDSNIFTKESKITSTTIEHVDSVSIDEKQGFWDRIFKRKKAPSRKEIKHLVLERLKISIDTLALLHEDSIINQLSQSISAIETDRQQSRNALMRQRMQLDRVGNSLISQLLIILNEMEHNELKRIEENNLLATSIINKGLSQISLILLVFILLIVIMATLIFTDIAKSNRYKKELIEARDEAEHLGNVKQRFLANMSHELRTPLQAIIGFAEQMKMHEQERTQKNIDIVYQSSQHLLHVVNEVLDYSRISSGRLSVESKQFRVKDVVQDIRELIAFQARQKGLDFIVSTTALSNENYLGDPFRLKQILFNLLHNAIKFTEQGTVELTVLAKETEQETIFQFRISDTGIGIADKDMGRVFGHFEQLETPQMQAGSGLGLSIVRSLVEHQGGSIEVRSTPGTGSDFIVNIAYRKIEAEIMNASDGVSVLPFEGCVWVIDDDPTILRLCELILRQHQVTFQSFNNASDLLHTEMPDNLKVILMDIRMPEMSGFELLGILRKRPAQCPLRYVALTAQSLPDEKNAIFEKGFSALLNKPFLAHELIAVLQDGSRLSAGMPDSISMLAEDREAIWASFLEETKHDLDLVLKYLNLEEGLKVADIFHRIAGRCGQLGLKDLAKAARSTEWRLRQGYFDPEEITGVHEQLFHFIKNEG